MNKLIRSSKSFLKRNSSTILTCIGAVGFVTTTVLVAKGTTKAVRLLEEAKEEKGAELTKLEVIKTAGPVYIPSVVVGVASLTCFFGANALNKRQQAALTSAYVLLDNSYKEYKKKVEEMYGEGADLEVTKELVKDKYDSQEPYVGGEKQLFFDMFSNRYFESTIETVQNAEYFVNRKLALWDAVDVNEFYDLLGIPRLEYDNFGWSVEGCFAMYGHSWIDFDHEKVIMDDGLECTIIIMPSEPILHYDAY